MPETPNDSDFHRLIRRTGILTKFYFLVNHKAIDAALLARPQKIKAVIDHSAYQCMNTEKHGLEAVDIYKENLRKYFRQLLTVI